MSIELIATKSVDRDLNPTGEAIALEDWLKYINSDKHLKLRTEPITIQTPSGMEISVNAGKGQSDVMCHGEKLPFLHHAQGELRMSYAPVLDDPNNPLRRKIAEIAKHFSAVITHDAGEEILNW